MKIKRPNKFVIRCKECGTVSHVKLKDNCPFCYAVGQGERVLVNAYPMGKLLKLDQDVVNVNVYKEN